MKRTLIILILCGVSALVNAQDFGKTLVSGSFNYTRSNNESGVSWVNPNKSTTFSFNPKVGFFLRPNLVLGATAGYKRDVFTSTYQVGSPEGIRTETSKTTGNTYSAGPFVRLYKALGNKAAFFGQGAAYYQKGKTEGRNLTSNHPSTPSTIKGGAAELTPGFAFFPSDIVGLELTLGSIGYSAFETDFGQEDNYINTSEFKADFGFNTLSFAISLYLGRSASE